jgi:putative SOS response-associated peptidase YedK
MCNLYPMRKNPAAILDLAQPSAFFAGIWTPLWTSVRKLNEGEVAADLFGFPASESSAGAGAVRPKAIAVLLTNPAELETWLTAPWEIAAELQRLPDNSLERLS